MAVRIRLKRMGAKKRPFYRLVVADSRSARDGRVIEQLGHYDPLADPSEIKVDEELARDWLSKGAQPSDTARRLLVQAGVIEAPTGNARGGEKAQDTEESQADASEEEAVEN